MDNGIYKIWLARNYKAHIPNTVLLDNALATMGAGLPSAMAARLVYPQKPIVAVCGDGGFMMNSQKLETAVRMKMNLIVIIRRNEGYGMIRGKQSQMGFQDFGLDYGNPDFVMYANSYGAKGYRVESAEAFLPLKLLSDGIPAGTLDRQGQAASLNLDVADRIVVLRGPSPSIYGSNAGGIINVSDIKPHCRRGFPHCELWCNA